ncbi:hypothetical protein B5S30_g281 [[Candida] boidinii]|nr:hypothetical protein B5S30_g281 [[Candida] boidinii]GMF97833.1 unnamed protein product [[Candida] boidinii]
MSEDRESELLKIIEDLKSENEYLKSTISKNSKNENDTININVKDESSEYPLTLEEYRRYGRQMTVPELGISGQLKLKASKVLVIGAGGLGCPSLMYLVGCGIGTIGIVDHDIVDISNLHRQVLHSTETVGMLKCDSAKKALNKLNPNVEIVTHPVAIANDNIFKIMENYDLVLDCTDTPATRYLINDAAVLLGKTIVSGSGLKTECQLSILNFENQGPCYRCFYPTPPPPNSVTSCSDGGVIGSVIGLMGVMMATEAIKVLTNFYTSDNFKPFLSLYSAYGPQQGLRTFKMRGRSPKCCICNRETRSINKELIESGALNYSVFCGKVNYNILSQEERIDVMQLNDLISKNNENLETPLIIDVRTKEQFDIISLSNSINIPLPKLTKIKTLEELKGAYKSDSRVNDKTNYYVICRYGNDSQLATDYLKNELKLDNVKDVTGGLNSWSHYVDDKFPVY